VPYDHFDQFDSFDDLFDTATEAQPLPPDIQMIYQRLLDDGAEWRGDVPAMPSLDERVQTMAQSFTMPRQAPGTIRQLPGKSTHSLFRRTARKKEVVPMTRTRFGRIAAAAAMVAVVALLIGVFAVLSHGRAPGHTSSPAATAVKQTQWQAIPGLGYSSERPDDSGPAVAPSDPRVVYESNVGREGAYGGQAFLRRTDDAGATWHNLAFPVPVTHIQWVNLTVSPLNPHTIILQVADNTTSDCPASFLALNTEANQNYCALQYLSTDGGATMSLLQTPTGNLASGVAFGASVMQAQGSTLYAQVECPDTSCVRIVRSSDGGHTWSLADEQLRQLAPYVCGFIAAPSGGTLFAVTADKSCLLSYQGTFRLTLWRSDDAGNSWGPVATLPTPNIYGLLAVDSGNSAQPLLYGFFPKTVSVTPDKAGFPHGNLSDNISDIYVSANGGKTWTHTPSQGIASGLSPFKAPLGVLSDGTIIASFIPQGFNNDNGDLTGSVLYGWKQGDTSWHQVAPALTKILAALTIVPGGNGHDTLWIMEESFNGQPWSDPDIYTAARFQL
jgi:hypothetical protein